MKAAQCRAARVLLGWSSHQLAQAAHLDLTAVRHFEDGAVQLSANALSDLSHALESAGVEFIAGRCADFGVRVRRGASQMPRGQHPQMS